LCLVVAEIRRCLMLIDGGFRLTIQMSTEEKEKKLTTRIQKKYDELDALEDQDLTPDLEKRKLGLNLQINELKIRINDIQIRATTDQDEKNHLLAQQTILLQSQCNTTQGNCLIPHLHTQNSLLAPP